MSFTAASARRAFTFGNAIRLAEHKMINAAVADYYFWWAWRLYSYGKDNSDRTALEIAVLCARAALSEICDIASLLLHEYSHYTGGYYEDYESRLGVGVEKGPHAGSPPDCKNCCHYLSGYTFLHAALATLGLPLPMVVEVVTTAGSVGGQGRGGRFDFPANKDWSFRFGLLKPPADSCGGLTSFFQAQHCDFWSAGHGVQISWSLPDVACWETIGGVGSTATVMLDGTGCSGASR